MSRTSQEHGHITIHNSHFTPPFENNFHSLWNVSQYCTPVHKLKPQSDRLARLNNQLPLYRSLRKRQPVLEYKKYNLVQYFWPNTIRHSPPTVTAPTRHMTVQIGVPTSFLARLYLALYTRVFMRNQFQAVYINLRKCSWGSVIANVALVLVPCCCFSVNM